MQLGIITSKEVNIDLVIRAIRMQIKHIGVMISEIENLVYLKSDNYFFPKFQITDDDLIKKHSSNHLSLEHFLVYLINESHYQQHVFAFLF